MGRLAGGAALTTMSALACGRGTLPSDSTPPPPRSDGGPTPSGPYGGTTPPPWDTEVIRPSADGGPIRPPADGGAIVLPEAETCALTRWSVIQSFGDLRSIPVLPHLRLHEGVLYLQVRGRGIVAVPVTGGDPVVLTNAMSAKLWIEEDSLYYANGGNLMELPLSGGPATLVADGMTRSGISDVAELDASYLYWEAADLADPAGWNLWRTPRAGGGAEVVAALPPRSPSYSWARGARAGDEMILAVDHQNIAYAVSLSGGGTRTLARPHALTSAPIRLLGVNGAGALWGPEFEPTDALSATSELSISDIGSRKDAIARPFWPDKPPGMRPVAVRSYPDGDDAWLITGVETLADGTMHVSVWHVDGSGNGARVGCGPALADESYGLIEAIVATPETVYAVLASSSASSAFTGYALVRIDRPAAAR